MTSQKKLFGTVLWNDHKYHSSSYRRLAVPVLEIKVPGRTKKGFSQ